MSKNDSDTPSSSFDGPAIRHDQDGTGLPWQNLADFYCNFFDLIGVMAIMVDGGGAIRMFNKRAEDLTGYSREESLGQDWLMLMLPEQSRTRVRERLAEGMRRDIEQMAFSMPILAKGGAGLQVCWSLSKVRDDEGQAYGMIALGYVPPGPAAPCVESSRALDQFSDSVDTMIHDLINHSQVALGYMELAIDRSGNDKDLLCMLDKAQQAIKKCGDIAVNVHRLSYAPRPGTGQP